jgi:hypothetical protein
MHLGHTEIDNFGRPLSFIYPGDRVLIRFGANGT